MKGYFEKELGKVYIEPAIVTRLCVLPELAASREFVLPNGPVPEDPSEQVNRKGVDRYILVDFTEEGEVMLELRLLVRYGPSVCAAAAVLQEKVAKRVENSTGLKVTKVDVKVDGVFRPAEPTALPTPKGESTLQIESNRNTGS